jgi:hypothetical protein
MRAQTVKRETHHSVDRMTMVYVEFSPDSLDRELLSNLDL